MSKSLFSNVQQANLESRVEKLERAHSGLEARLINLTTLIRSQYGKGESPGDRLAFADIYTRIDKLEQHSLKTSHVPQDIEYRIARLENTSPLKDFQKALEQTHEKIKDCMQELRETFKIKEQELSQKIREEFNGFKASFDIRQKSPVLYNPHMRKKSDEIENIIQELQQRLEQKSATPRRNRSNSFSILRNNSYKTSQGQQKSKKKLKTKVPKKVKFNN